MHVNVYLYILIMALTTCFMRVIALTLVRRPVRSLFLQSFLFYVPYVTLAVMTFPAITEATQSPLAGLAALAAGILCAWFGAGLFHVAACCCTTVFLLELFLI